MGTNKDIELLLQQRAFEEGVLRCWRQVHVDLLDYDIDEAPELQMVYESFLADVAEETLEEYEQIFGSYTPPRQDWIEDFILPSETIVGMVGIATILLKYGFCFAIDGDLYGHYQQRLLRPRPIILEET